MPAAFSAASPPDSPSSPALPIKPTSSILTERQSIDADGKNVDIRTKGRHDPCVGIRAVPIGEAMVACAIADHYLRDRGQTGRLK
jgi:chorismate synthase